MFKLPTMDQKGVAAVEMAIVTPLLALILFGAIEMGLLLYNKQVITNASREGARAAIVSDVPTNPAGTVSSYCTNRLVNLVDNNNDTIVTISPEDMDGCITVSVSYHYKYLFVSLLGLSETTLIAQTTMKAE